MYDMKALYEASSVENAVALRLEHPEAQIIAGGSDVLVQMREGRRAGAELISIYGLDELRGVSIDADENIRIGSLTEQTHGIIVLTCRQGISHLLQQYICRLCQKRHRTQESEEKKSQGFHFKVYIVKQPEISQ